MPESAQACLGEFDRLADRRKPPLSVYAGFRSRGLDRRARDAKRGIFMGGREETKRDLHP